jgi:hypothetical protein
MQTRGTPQANAPADKMLQPPQPESTPNSRPLSIMTTGTSATAQDKTGETWKMHVTEDNCWEDLILTLGTYCCSEYSQPGRIGYGRREDDRRRHSVWSMQSGVSHGIMCDRPDDARQPNI